MTEKKVRKYLFRNITSRNVFTSMGRCLPSETVRLTSKEGDGVKGLELVRKGNNDA